MFIYLFDKSLYGIGLLNGDSLDSETLSSFLLIIVKKSERDVGVLFFKYWRLKGNLGYDKGGLIEEKGVGGSVSNQK